MSTKAVLQPHNANTSTDRPTIKGNSPSTPAMPPTPVRVSYAALQAACDDPSDPSAACLAGQLLAAYGPDGLGLILVDGVPDLAARRAALLPLASSLAQLPDATRAQLEDPQSSYNIGWSHGKETLANGVPGGVPPQRSPASLPYPWLHALWHPLAAQRGVVLSTPRHLRLQRPARPVTPQQASQPDSEWPTSSLTVCGCGGCAPDLLKASFYANPMLDVPTTDPALIAQ
jgi:hypothetical protein